MGKQSEGKQEYSSPRPFSLNHYLAYSTYGPLFYQLIFNQIFE